MLGYVCNFFFTNLLWKNGPGRVVDLAYYYPDVPKDLIILEGYVTNKSSHS